MLISLRKQSGLSMIEILVSLVLSLVVIAAVFGVFTNSLTGSQLVLGSGKLERDLQTLMDFIAGDIQRTGYWSNATSSSTNPFIADTNIFNVTTNCVIFSYDRNNTGSTNDATNYGYRLSGGAIQFRPSGSTSSFTCGAATNLWTNLTDTNVITITQFTTTLNTTNVTIQPSSTNTTSYRTLTLTIGGKLNSNPGITTTNTRTIKIYNNKYVP